MAKKVILLSGKIKSGKDVAAKFLTTCFENNYTIEKISFASELKQYCSKDFKNFEKLLNDYSVALKNIIPNISPEVEAKINELKISEENWFENKTFITRVLLQTVGTKIFRGRIDDNYWVNIVKNKCKQSKCDIIIVTDCRFINEIEDMYDDEYEVISIRLLRNTSKNKHFSETDLDEYNNMFNYVVDNRKNSIDSFYRQISMIANDILSENKNEEPDINFLSNKIINNYYEILNVC